MEEEKKEAAIEEPVEKTADPKPAQAAKDDKYAGFGIRLLAFIIDAIIIGIVSRPFTIAFDFGGDTFAPAANALSTLITWTYYVLLDVNMGTTLGKTIFGLKVVNKEGQRLDYTTAIIRETVGKLVSAIILGIGFLMIAFDSKKQGLHDKIANTYVVRK